MMLVPAGHHREQPKRALHTLLLTMMLAPTLNAAEHEHTYRGHYIWGPEVHSFQPCGEQRDYWVSFDWAGRDMQRFYKSADKTPYQPMYIEFRGQILNEVTDGFAKDYAGLIRISEVQAFTLELPDTCR